MQVTLMSQSIHDPQPDCDFLFDVRDLHDPVCGPNWKQAWLMNGTDRVIRSEVMETPRAQHYARRIWNLVDYWEQNHTSLTLLICCEGGEHRSVSLVEYMSRWLMAEGYPVIVQHRTLEMQAFRRQFRQEHKARQKNMNHRVLTSEEKAAKKLGVKFRAGIYEAPDTNVLFKQTLESGARAKIDCTCGEFAYDGPNENLLAALHVLDAHNQPLDVFAALRQSNEAAKQQSGGE